MSGNTGIAQSFQDLGINIENFSKLDPQERVRVLAEAYKNNPDRDKAFADLFKIMEDDAKRFLVLFKGGAAAIAAAEAEAVGGVSKEGARHGEKELDKQAERPAITPRRRREKLGLLETADKIARKAEDFGNWWEKVIFGGDLAVRKIDEVSQGVDGVSRKSVSRAQEIQKELDRIEAFDTTRNERFLKKVEVDERFKQRAPFVGPPDAAAGLGGRAAERLFPHGTGTPALMNMQSSATVGEQRKDPFPMLKELRDLQLKQNQATVEYVNLLKREL